MDVSVVIRVRDEAGALARLLSLLARQRTAHEVIVVDNASVDASAQVATATGARLTRISRREFTFGRALNQGVGLARAPVVVALSAHAYPPDPDWLGRMVAAFEDPACLCAFGPTHGPDNRPMIAPFRQDATLARERPDWGYSNGAGAFRAALWHERPFREDMPGMEDREWALWALRRHRGYCLMDPALGVVHDHSRDGLAACFRRYRREAQGMAMFAPDRAEYGTRQLVGEWWSDQGWHRSRARARLDPRRAARLLGKRSGFRSVR